LFNYRTGLWDTVQEPSWNKLIHIGDSSTGGWEIVSQYEPNPVASDSEDESRIIKTENRAIKWKHNSSQGRGSISTPYSLSGVPPISLPWSTSSQLRPATERGKLFRGHYGYGNAVFTPGAVQWPRPWRKHTLCISMQCLRTMEEA